MRNVTEEVKRVRIEKIRAIRISVANVFVDNLSLHYTWPSEIKACLRTDELWKFFCNYHRAK